jgi:hypothetical protein
MIEIKDLLSKFDKLLEGTEVKKEIVRKTISETLNIPIKKEEIEIKNNSVFLKIKPIYKNELLMKQEKILLELEKVLGQRTPKDFR